MSTISDAVSESAKSAVVGYKITKGDFSEASPNLPQRVVILSEANTAKQSGLNLAPFEATSIAKVAERLGDGSPAYMAMRILRPLNGGGLTGIPIMVYPVESASGATASTATVTITGTPTKNVKHYLILGGRPSLDGQPYSVNITPDDTPITTAAKYAAAINAVYGTFATAASALGVVTLTSKFKGISSAFEVRVETNGDAAGLTYAIAKTSGTGTGKVSDALAKFENNWNTIVLNPYGADSDVLDTMESVNGKPDPETPTGRYAGIVFKPFISLFSKSTTDPLTDVVVSGRTTECTNVYCPAPNVYHLPIEVAANVARIVAQVAQNTPNLDYLDKSYPDAIVDNTGIGDYADYDYRDACVKAGLSTVDFVAGEIVIKDLVTTYNPSDEVTPQFKYARNLILDWNVRYGYKLLEQVNVVAHTLVPDGTITSAQKTVSPKQWKGVVSSYFDSLADRGLVAEPSFAKNSLQVKISSTNPDRFETFFRYKRTGIARISSTTAEAGFYYGGN